MCAFEIGIQAAKYSRQVYTRSRSDIYGGLERELYGVLFG